LGPADLQGIANLAAASRDGAIVLPGDSRLAVERDAVTAFSEGRTLFMRNWPVSRDQIGPKVEYGVVAPPTASVLGGQNLAISSSTERPRAARALLEFLASSSSQLILSEIGGFAPTRQSAFANAKRPYSQELRTAVDRARLRPSTPHYTDFSRAFRKGIARALNDGGRLEPGFARELAAILHRG
jgi:multiple sugar transport system substrate-binding protein